MSQPWKLLPWGVGLAVLGLFLIMPGGVTQPHPASAEFNCIQRGTLNVNIMDTAGGQSFITAPGTIVEISPSPINPENDSLLAIDNQLNDDSNLIGSIQVADACRTNAPSVYEIELISLPEALEDCDVIAATAQTSLVGTATAILQIECSDVDLTPTPDPTATPGPAATVTTSASPDSVPCGGTSIVTIHVYDEDGEPVAAGAAVELTASIGSVTPSSGETTDASGSAWVFFEAPSGQSGTATIEATSGEASGSFDVTVRDENCDPGSAPAPTATTAPPPPTVTPGIITPPNTGDAGLAAGGSNASAGLAAIVLALAVLGVRLTRSGRRA